MARSLAVSRGCAIWLSLRPRDKLSGWQFREPRVSGDLWSQADLKLALPVLQSAA